MLANDRDGFITIGDIAYDFDDELKELSIIDVDWIGTADDPDGKRSGTASRYNGRIYYAPPTSLPIASKTKR